jgi:hypothetical protein
MVKSMPRTLSIWDFAPIVLDPAMDPYATAPREEPYAGKLPVRICARGAG